MRQLTTVIVKAVAIFVSVFPEAFHCALAADQAVGVVVAMLIAQHCQID